MRERRQTLVAEIRDLLAAPSEGAAAPAVAALEEALTSGYAHALALEAERLRLEERFGNAARKDAAPGDGGAGELAELAELIASADRDLTRLRALLVVLRDRMRAARAAATVA